MRFVLGDAGVADLAVSEPVFDDMECLFAPRPYSDLRLLDRLAHLIQTISGQRSALAAPHGDMPVHIGFKRFATLIRELMARIAEYILLITMQQMMDLGNVSHIGGRALERVNNDRMSIGADMRPYAKVVQDFRRTPVDWNMQTLIVELLESDRRTP